MDTYQPLSKLFYVDATPSRYSSNTAEAQRRLTCPSTFRTGIELEHGELFLAVPRELTLLHEDVHQAERAVAGLWNSLPGAARWAYVRALVMNEIHSSNLIEGVSSSRREIETALNSIQGVKDGQGETRRFKEFARLYLGITDHSSQAPQTVRDIRDVYDRVVCGEVGLCDQPDGALFRADVVDVVSQQQKVLHTGVYPESKIVAMLTQMIELTSNGSMPALYASLVAHFLFEYIHPFYDGNGRTGRYLLALNLSRSLSVTTALSLSHVITQNRGAYYHAFESVEKPLNHSEATFFVLAMLRLVRLAQDEAIVSLQEKSFMLERIDESIYPVSQRLGISPKAQIVLEYMAQTHLFELTNGNALGQIARHMGFSEQTARKYLQELEDCQAVTAVSRKPLRYSLSPAAREAFDLA